MQGSYVDLKSKIPTKQRDHEKSKSHRDDREFRQRRQNRNVEYS